VNIMGSNISLGPPPAGWALTRDLPPGYVKETARPGMRLWIVYLVLLAIGFMLTTFGYWVRFQSTSSTTAASNPEAQFRSGQEISAIGSVFIVAGLVLAVVSIVMRVRSTRGATERPAPGSDASLTSD
jgi:hypothetical protein